MEIRKEDIDEAVVNFCLNVIETPLIFFNESDLHLLLCEKLFEKIPRLKNSYYPTNVSKLDNSNDKYQTRLIHREYGANDDRAIDIVIFDDEDIDKIETSRLTLKSNKGKKYIQPYFAFELGICRDISNHIENDINKLLLVKENGVGYILHIYRDESTTRSNKDRRRNTEESIKEKLKSPIEIVIKKLPEKIKVIAIVINPIRLKDTDWNKYEIFNKHDDSWYSYKEIDKEPV